MIAAANPLAAMVANPNFFILVPSSMSVPGVRAVARESRFGRCVGRFGASLCRSDCLNVVLRPIIPMAEIDRRLAGIDYFSLPAAGHRCAQGTAAAVCPGPHFGKRELRV